MAVLSNTPRSETVVTVEARKSFAFGIQFLYSSNSTPIDITGATVRMVVSLPRRLGGTIAIDRDATILNGPLGLAQIALQADDLDFAEDEYPFSVTLVSALGYSTLILKGVLDLRDNTEHESTGATYADINPSTNLAAYLRDNNLVTVKIDHVDGLYAVVTDLIVEATATLEDLVERAEAAANLALATAGQLLVVDNGDGTYDVTSDGAGFILEDNGDGTADLSLDGTTVTVGNPEAGQLLAANNLSDVASASASRANLELGSAALADETDFEVAGAASARLAKASNLSDLTDASVARDNLGLGTAAEVNSTVFVAASTVGAASGVAPLDSGTRLPVANAPVTTFAAASLTGPDVGLPATTETTVLTTSALSVGVWLISAKILVNVLTASTAANVEARVTAGGGGGGAATFTAQGLVADQKFSGSNGTVGNQVVALNLQFFATVTVAGTISMTARSSIIANACVATPQMSWPGATGYTAVKQVS
jgi:hypothetical protein